MIGDFQGAKHPRRWQGYLVLCLLAVGSVAGADDLPFRDWSDLESHQVRARMVGWEGDVVRLRLLFDGRILDMPVANLIAADRDYVAQWKHVFAPAGEALPAEGLAQGIDATR